MFEGFSYKQIEATAAKINLAYGGEGYPVLLLHGYPQTHACWHKIAPLLAKHFTVVCTDLRGYGDSSKPPGDSQHFAYSKRQMAQDQIEAMQFLGFNDFAVVGHDRGARVARRMAIDYADKIKKLVLLDIVPTSRVFASINKAKSAAHFHWFFLIQPDGLPERLIQASPDFFLDWILNRWCATPGAISDEAVAEYRRCFDAATIHATCEDYRAGATVDLIHDEADKERIISCPLLLLWRAGGIGAEYDVLQVWREQALDVRGCAFDCGHFLAEERPDQTAGEIIRFLS